MIGFFAIGVLGCVPPEAAPRNLDQLAHDLWAHYAAADDAALALDVEDVRALLAAGDAGELPTDGTLTDLTTEEAALGGMEIDPASGAGFFTAGFIGCTPEQQEHVLSAADQLALYPANYTAYARTFTSSLSEFESRASPGLTWDGSYSVNIPLLGAYDTAIKGGMRNVDAGDAGPYLYSRTVMPAPAVTASETMVFDMDFQIEAYFPQDEGMVHLFVNWRHLDLGSGVDTDNDGTVRLILNELHDWDDDTTKICADGGI